jgi:hypothetical protein
MPTRLLGAAAAFVWADVRRFETLEDIAAIRSETVVVFLLRLVRAVGTTGFPAISTATANGEVLVAGCEAGGGTTISVSVGVVTPALVSK